MAGLEELYENTIGKVDTGEERNALLRQFGDNIEYYTPPALRKHVEALGAILPNIVSSADHKEMIEASGDISEDVTSGGMNMDTVNRILDLTGASAAAFLPYLEYRNIKNTGNTVVDKISEAMKSNKGDLSFINKLGMFVPQTLKDLVYDINEQVNLGQLPYQKPPVAYTEPGPIGRASHGTGYGTPSNTSGNIEEPFETFDPSKLGVRGEGGQGTMVKGQGHYFGSDEDIAKFYRLSGLLNKIDKMSDPDAAARFANEALGKVDGKPFMQALDEVLSGFDTTTRQGYDLKQKAFQNFMKKHYDKIRPGYGDLKKVNIKALKERLVAIDYTFPNQSKAVQAGVLQSFDDIKSFLQEVSETIPGTSKEISNIMKYLTPPSKKSETMGHVFRGGSQKIVGNQSLEQILRSWRDGFGDLAKLLKKPIADPKVDALRQDLLSVIQSGSMTDKILENNGIQGFKFTPGTTAGRGQVPIEVQKTKPNYVIFDGANIEMQEKQLEFDFGEQ